MKSRKSLFRMQLGSSTYLRSEKISEVALKHIFYSFHVFNPIIIEIFKHVDRFFYASYEQL